MAKILIIEDDPMISRVYQKIFTFENFEVDLAENGEEGIIKAKSLHPSLILLDIMMPKKNGIDTLDALKTDSQTKTIPVIVLTNLVGGENENTALASGAEMCLTKSEHEPEEVVKIVNQVLAEVAPDELN